MDFFKGQSMVFHISNPKLCPIQPQQYTMQFGIHMHVDACTEYIVTATLLLLQAAKKTNVNSNSGF